MFYPILLSMIAAATGVPAQAPEPTIRISLNSDGQYLPGDKAKVQVITRDDGYLVVFQVNPEGKLRVLFPLDPTDDNYVKGGKRYLLLGRGGREGFPVDAPGTGVVFAAVSIDPWRYAGYVQNDHWDYRALNTVTYDETESDLVDLAQGMAGGRFDYDVLGYTVASQVAVTEEPVSVSASVGVIDGCFNCVAPVGVIYGTGYYNTWGLYDPWYYSPYYNYGPYYPAWGYAPTWGWGWGCYGYGCNTAGYWGGYYPPYANAVAYSPYSPYVKKGYDRNWSGAPTPYRPRGVTGYTATNTVAGALPGIGVQQHASFRNRTWDGASAVAGVSAVAPSAVPVSKAGYSASGSGNGNGGRRRDAAPAPSGAKVGSPAVGGTAGGGTAGGKSSRQATGAPMAVPARPRAGSQAVSPSASVSTGTSTRQGGRPEARPARTGTEQPSVGAQAGGGRMQMPVEWTRPPATVAPAPVSRKASEAPPVSRAAGETPPVSRAAGETPPVSRAAAEGSKATRASGEGASSEPVLRRREPEQAPAAAAPAARPEPQAPSRGYSSPPPQNQPSGSAGGGYSGGGRASAPPPSAAPAGTAGGGGRRR